jgi:hypothetical protein
MLNCRNAECFVVKDFKGAQGAVAKVAGSALPSVRRQYVELRLRLVVSQSGPAGVQRCVNAADRWLRKDSPRAVRVGSMVQSRGYTAAIVQRQNA